MKCKMKCRKDGNRSLFHLNLVVFILSVTALLGYGFCQNVSNANTQRRLQQLREKSNESAQYEMQFDTNGLPVAGIAAVFAKFAEDLPPGEGSGRTPEILPKYRELHEINPDMTGWLTIDGTVIDYPVMQTMEDECYYLNRNFYGDAYKNGCLILDTDSTAGTGTEVCGYKDGTAPSTNLIIHGHTMKSGEMFGNLKLYADAKYGAEHAILSFDSLYEEREYELIAVFYSQVYYESDNVFKYYKFFRADTQEEFDDWYENIKKLSLYDTGVTAQFGDEFLTLSCCSYQVEDGRFVVVGKRVK